MNDGRLAVDPDGARLVARRLNRVALWSVAAVALVVWVFGWLVGSLTGTALHPGLDGMKANTALGLLALTAAGMLLRDEQATGPTRWLGWALASFSVLLGLATAAQDVLGVDLHIDTALFDDPEGLLTPGAPGRMSPLTAAALVFAGLSLLLVQRHGRITIALREGAAALAMALPLFVIASHVYGSPIFEALTQMSTSTRWCLVVFAVALFTMRPAEGRGAHFWNDTPGAYVERRLVPVIMVGILVLGWLATFAQDRGVDDAVATAFFAMALIVVTVLIVHGSTRSLDRAESRRREAEAAVLEARERLVAAMAEQRLYNAKLQFVNRAAHELNTPLTPVRVQTELLASGRLGALSDAQVRSVTQLARNVDRLAHKVRQIVDAAETRDRSPNLRPEPVALDALVRNAVDGFRMVARNAGIKIEAHVPRGHGVVVAGDAERLELALSNLIVNAVEATPERGRIDVVLHEDDAEVRIQVQDTGKGLDEEAVKLLFRPFTDFEEARSTLPSDAGLGLGLYTALRIVRAHGGTITGTSPGPGAGATFTITLPVSRQEGQPPATGPVENSAASGPPLPPAGPPSR